MSKFLTKVGLMVLVFAVVMGITMLATVLLPASLAGSAGTALLIGMAIANMSILAS